MNNSHLNPNQSTCPMGRGCRFVFLDLRGEKVRRMEKPPLPSVLCLGNFDGVHLAHTALLREGEVLRKAHLPHGLLGVFTFFTPSYDFLSANQTGRAHLTTLKEKLALFAAAGVDFVCLCHFEDVRALPAEDFLTLLSHELGVAGVVCGFNFRFGAGGRGDSALLSSYFDAPREGRFCAVVPPFLLDGEAVSSTRIRGMLSDGRAEDACRHLGRPYALLSRVIHGKHLGRAWGFPTANQRFLPESLIPAHGVYAVLCHTPEGVFPGVANVGSHPTVDASAPVNCETHVMGDFAGDLYGHTVKIEFLCRLRDEMKFDTEDALRSAIAKDAETAKAYVAAYLAEREGKA